MLSSHYQAWRVALMRLAVALAVGGALALFIFSAIEEIAGK